MVAILSRSRTNPWTDEENSTLRRLVCEERMPVEQIAKVLKRGIFTVTEQIADLDLRNQQPHVPPVIQLPDHVHINWLTRDYTEGV